jgi:hypothetical protein
MVRRKVVARAMMRVERERICLLALEVSGIWKLFSWGR